jgi:hypothetical protein
MKYKIFYSFFGGSKETGISSYKQEIEDFKKLIPGNFPEVDELNSMSRRRIADSLNELNKKKEEGKDYFYENVIIFNNIKKLFDHVLVKLTSDEISLPSDEISQEINFILSGFNRIDINNHEDLGVILQLTKRVNETSPIFLDFSRGWYPDHIQKLHKNFVSYKITPFKRNSFAENLNFLNNPVEYINKNNLHSYDTEFPIVGSLNHEENPNCILTILKNIENDAARVAMLIPLRDIEANEQLTISYAEPFTSIYNAIYNRDRTYASKLSQFESIKDELAGLKKSDWFSLHPNVSNEFLELFDYLIQMNESVEDTVNKIKDYENIYYELESLKLLDHIIEKNTAKITFLNRQTSGELVNIRDKFSKVEQVLNHEEMQDVRRLMSDIDTVVRAKAMNLVGAFNIISKKFESLPDNFF